MLLAPSGRVITSTYLMYGMPLCYGQITRGIKTKNIMHCLARRELGSQSTHFFNGSGDVESIMQSWYVSW